MADIINLRQARKVKARADKERAAEANRAKFGRTKADRESGRLAEARRERQLEGCRRNLASRPNEQADKNI